ITTCDDRSCNQHVCATGICDPQTGQCVYTPVAGTVCRASAGECDIAEVCDGRSLDCPADAKQPSGTSCTSDGNPCTLDQCDGTNVTCQHPPGNAGVVCRPSAGVCDVAETCTGTSPQCPADAFASSATECRAAAGVCDV